MTPFFRFAFLVVLVSLTNKNAVAEDDIGESIRSINDILSSLGATPSYPTTGKSSHHENEERRGRRGVRGLTGVSREPRGEEAAQEETARQLAPKKKGTSTSSSDDDKNCPKKSKDLDEFQQWRDEVGYWIGEYTLLDGNGDYNVNNDFPYPYDHYTGFITGNIEGGAYRQRNVFLYPPNTADRCNEIINPKVFDNVPGAGGACGVNGNSLVFFADQSGCSDDGSIAGTFGPTIETKTELVGADNALLYQVFALTDPNNPKARTMIQSQLTTIHADNNSRTRTAQQFSFQGEAFDGTSYYRESKVSKAEFYQALQDKIDEYNILSSGLCVTNGFGRLPAYTVGGFQTCMDHLEQSFDL